MTAQKQMNRSMKSTITNTMISLRSPQRINHEETKSAKVFSDLFFVPFVSSWLILIVSGRRNAA